MVNRNILMRLRKKFRADSAVMEKAFVSAYVKRKGIAAGRCQYISEYMSFCEKEDIVPIEQYIFAEDCIQGMEDLIAAFELLLDEKDKKNKGMFYTPYPIKEYILEKVMLQEKAPKIIDPACGCGSFLVTAARKLKQKYKISYHKICTEHLFGVDIDKHSIEKAIILLNLLALEEGEEPVEKKSNLLTGNSLEILYSKKYRGRFDAVVGNPPYVRAKNIGECLKKSLKNWTVVAGNVDLYIPFYQLGVSLLNENGKLGFISPNTFLQSVNGRKLRTYLVELQREISILDFRENQAFQDITHYTCVCIIDKERKSRNIKYALLNGAGSLFQYEFTEYHMDSYKEDAEWRFGNSSIDGVISRIENQEQKLEDYKIRNGLATLKNDLYFFTPIDQDQNYYRREYKGKVYQIEKSLCIPVAKPNVMRTEEDLEKKIQQAIFPYRKRGDRLEIIGEKELQEQFPKTYIFLDEYRKELLSRDKGKGNSYPAWYAYGRTQGMNNQGKKLLIPYMAEKGVAILSQKEDLLFYCGYAVFCDDTDTLKIIKKLMESKVFWYYISNTSKPYSKGYMALAKNYIKNFGIPHMEEEQRRTLLELEPGELCEEYIASLYGLTFQQLEKRKDQADSMI